MKAFTTEEVREQISKLRGCGKTMGPGPQEAPYWYPDSDCHDAADALEYLLQFVEWKPIEMAPHHEDVLLYREDAGGFMGRCDCPGDWLVDPESQEGEELGEDVLTQYDWWAYTQDGPYRLEGEEVPTHYHELPPPLQEKKAEATPASCMPHTYDPSCWIPTSPQQEKGSEC